MAERFYWDLLALVAIIEGRAQGRERDALFAAGVNPRNTPAGRRLCVENREQGRRADLAAAYRRLTPAQQQTLKDDGVFTKRPFVHYDPGRPRWRVVAFGYEDKANGDQFVLPEEVAAYTAARRAGRPFVTQYAAVDADKKPKRAQSKGARGKQAKT